ncbi:pyruvate dehydrogenase (acetyl-transferring) E1 component subunit alpha [Hymenobacter busanensis]|uniref:Pyruvate dehydrogenase E1 component subunit alpha n=1 Tax=Hymenobacter busanensis TaxID=2607656 RepID=A0A7L4ZZW5_9BACT|nr:pyruvate dehydrogenase (acetyl-transferring) E1 component subunit alpha [Hymenobacter busanensis]KAA9332939.1 pyruvate dehydrogenase (acetyl-transferring) E1 component subunit alpha [Hymenobacter busanensis]QHJ08386.1 pyruvate dehydrogenase (acetyl-transferring) E1 component subunit alpha [Hymenobacter busanensis]
MADTKVKAASKASNSAGKAKPTPKNSTSKSNGKAAVSAAERQQPEPVEAVQPGAEKAAGAKASKTAQQPASKGSFPKETYMTWFESMLLMRRFEEKAGQLYGQQKIKGFCHLYIGQEACVAGAVSALRQGDKYITAYRDHAHPLGLGTSPNAIMAELFAKQTGCSKGKGGSMHIFDKSVNFIGGHGIVGGQVPLGAGIAFAEKYNKTGNLCICYMGDGAVRQGALHEAFNMAMLWKLPVIFVVENNGYAMGTSVQRTSNVTELYTIGEAYDMPSEPVDAMHVEEVHNAVARAAERARAGEGPSFLEFKTYRYKGHSMSDPAKYRTKEEVEEYRMRDSIENVRHTILTQGMATEDELNAIDEKLKAVVAESVEFAEQSPYPPAEELYRDVYVQEDYPFIRE